MGRLKYFLLIFYISGHYCTLSDIEHGSSFYQDKCSDQQLKTLTQNYLSCWEFETDSNLSNDYCESITQGEAVCRHQIQNQDPCAGHSSITPVLMMVTRANQALDLSAMGWGDTCPILTEWASQMEHFYMRLATSKHRNIGRVFKSIKYQMK